MGDQPTNCGKAAIAYAQKFGWHVFPVHTIRDGKCSCGKADCGSPGKHPLTRNGVKDATTDPDQIRMWWKEWPDANVGIAGGNGLVILDIDPRHGGDESLDELITEHGPLPDTPEVLTGGGGRHLYFTGAAPNKVGVMPGLDLRGAGGYVVEAESRPETLPRAALPTYLVPQAERGQGNGPTIDRIDPDELFEGIPAGERHDRLFRYACRLRTQDMKQSEAIVLVREAAARCTPPYTDESAEKLVSEAWKFPAGKTASILHELDGDSLSAPMVTRDDRSVTIEWFRWQVKAEARSLKEHSDGKITGHLKISTSLPGVARQLRSSQFTFTAWNTRSALAKDLSGKLPEVPWDTMLEFLGTTVTEYIQGGEPIETITPNDDVDPTAFVLWPLLVHGNPTLIFGKEGSAKSYLALLICYLAIAGTDEQITKFGMRREVQAKTCLYLDWEGTANAMRDRMKSLYAGTGLSSGVELEYRRCGRSLASDVDQIKASLAGQKPGILVVDSLIPAVGGNPLDAMAANDFFAALRSFDCTSLLLGHAPKSTVGTAAATVYGSGVFQFLTRSLWEVRRHQEEEESEMHIGLVHKKVNYGPLERQIGFRFVFDTGRTSVERADVSRMPDMESAQALTWRIMNLLETQGTMGPKEIADSLEVSQNQVRARLSYLRDKGKIAPVKRGVWGAVTQELAPF